MFMSFDKRLYIYASVIVLSSSRLFVLAALPAALQSSIPTCAQSCLEDFIEQEYSSFCLDLKSLDCLCSHYGPGGYALGEGAYACIYAPSCSSVSKSNSSSVYSICAGQPGVVSPRHKTIPYTPTPIPQSTSGSSTATTTTDQTSSPTAMTEASVSAGPDGINVSGKMSLTMAQIAGITIAAAALIILTVGIFSCLFFVRKRNKRLELEDQKALTYNTPKSPDMQDIYFPPPPTMDRRSRRGSSFSMLSRRREPVQEQGIMWGDGTTIQRDWPRYYPVMPQSQENIGVAETTNYAHQVAPTVRSSVASYTPTIPAPYTPVTPVSFTQPTPAPYTPATPASYTQPTPAPYTPATPASYTQPTIAPYTPILSASATPPISYQIPPPAPAPQTINLQSAGMVLPGPPPIAHTSAQRRPSHGSRRRSRAPSRTRKSRALSAMTDIEESAQTSSREISLLLQSQQTSETSADNSGGEQSSGNVSATSSTKRSRKPTLTINIPLKISSRLPPPPASRPTSSLPPPPSSRPTSSLPPPPSSRPTSALPPPPPSRPVSSVAPPPGRPPLLRENQMAETSIPSQLLAVATSYGARSSTTGSSTYSPALPSSQVMAGAGPTFLLSDSESRSNSSGRKHSRGSRRDSDASCTSFEDVESDDDMTPPKEADKRLSPVKETSPVSYPKVPRGSNQAVPRSPASPKSPSKTQSGGSNTPTRSPRKPNPNLAINQSIGNKLWKTELSPQGKKPLPTPEWAAQRRTESWESWAVRERDENTVAAGAAGTNTVWTTPEMLGSPFMPKITPTKRGEDMVLEFR